MRAQYPGITRFYEAFEDHGQLFLVTEQMPGGDLGAMLRCATRPSGPRTPSCRERCAPVQASCGAHATPTPIPVALVLCRRRDEKDDPLPEKVVWSYFIQLLLALRYMHHCHVLHGDIKPGNVLLDCAEEVVKLTDLGISQILNGVFTRAKVRRRGGGGHSSHGQAGQWHSIARHLPAGGNLLLSFTRDVARRGLLVQCRHLGAGLPAVRVLLADSNVLRRVRAAGQEPGRKGSEYGNHLAPVCACASADRSSHRTPLPHTAHQVLSGRVELLPQRYSMDLGQVLYLMMRANPADRPTADEILMLPQASARGLENGHPLRCASLAACIAPAGCGTALSRRKYREAGDHCALAQPAGCHSATCELQVQSHLHLLPKHLLPWTASLEDGEMHVERPTIQPLYLSSFTRLNEVLPPAQYDQGPGVIDSLRTNQPDSHSGGICSIPVP